MGFTTMQKATKYILVAGIFFLLGGFYREGIMKKYITDDCRVIHATRFGDVFIKCDTIQRYD